MNIVTCAMNLVNPTSLLFAPPSLFKQLDYYDWIFLSYSFRKCLLCDYEYIHQCRKFSTPVEVVVVEKHRPSPTHLARRDRFPGTNASSTSPIPSATPLSSLTYSSHLSKCLSIKEANYLLDGFHAKEEKFRKFLESKEGPVSVGT